jgi:3-dehydroquinate dehydratase-1
MSAATVRIGAVELGPGRPRVCVPLTGATVEALEAEALEIDPAVADLVELRIDRFAEVGHGPAVEHAIDAVRSALPAALPILFTCRSAREGGGADLPPTALEALVLLAARHPGIAAVDVEMDAQDGLAPTLARIVHAEGRPVVMSFHDLAGTPPRAEIVARLTRQQDLGADVVKLACTPSSPADVLVLLAATDEYASGIGARPAVTMAMGRLGVLSRLAGETFGSALTFGTVGAASAPGQVDAARLLDALELIHGAQAA